MIRLRWPLALILTALLIGLLYAVPVKAESYQVQAGDLIKIDLPGETSLEEAFAVDRQGRVLLPEIGLVPVSGTFESGLKDLLSGRLAEVFLDLNHLEVYVAKRQLLISVQGYVEQPGEFILPANGTVQMAFHAAGGLRAGAQLNLIQLVRANKREIFNYKQYLESGDLSLLPPLKSLDTLFIPSSPMTGNIEVDFDPANVADGGDAAEDRLAIKVFGEVNNPGSYSYKAATSLIDLLMRAGGVTRYAGIEQIRLLSGGEPQLFNLKHYLDRGDSELLPIVEAGSTIFVPHIEEQVKTGGNIVYVMGEVAKPGAYEGQEGATFMDILANAGGPTRFAESRQIRIIKASGKVNRFDFAGYTEGTVKDLPPIIEAGDAIFVPEKIDKNVKSWLKMAPDRVVRVLGEVLHPGRIEWSEEMTLLDLLAHVGGPSSTADTSSIEIIIIDPKGRTSNHRFDLDAFIRLGQGDHLLPKIRAGATVRVHKLHQDLNHNKSQWVHQNSDKSIYVFGQVGAPGRYMFTDAMHFLDILAAADGPTGNADIHNIRISHRGERPVRISQLNLALYFETGDEELLPRVRTGDTIFIPEKNRIWLDQSKETTVRVIGAINKPGRYRFNDEMTLLDLLAEAGGPNSEANINKISVINLSCCRNQVRNFNLAKFSRNATTKNIPVLRAGDTVFVPSRRDSTIGKLRVALKDIFQFSVLALLL